VWSSWLRRIFCRVIVLFVFIFGYRKRCEVEMIKKCADVSCGNRVVYGLKLMEMCGKYEGKGMKRSFVVLFVAVNVLIVALGAFIAYSDLYMKEYSRRTHENTAVIEVEHSPFGYRPTYEYYEVRGGETIYVVSEGSWTLDFFQLSIIVMAIVDLLWLLYIR
jgi:hypothetical protein